MQDMNKKKQELLFQELYNVLSAHIYNTGNMPTLVFTKEKIPSRVPAHHVRYSENEGRVTINMDEFGMKEEEIKAKLKCGFSGHVRIDNVPCELVSRFDVTTDVERVRNAVGAKGTVVEAPELGGCITQVAGRGISAEEMKMYTESAAPSNEGGVGVNPNGTKTPATLFSSLGSASPSQAGGPSSINPGVPPSGRICYPNSVPPLNKKDGKSLCNEVMVMDGSSYLGSLQLLGYDPYDGGCPIPNLDVLCNAVKATPKTVPLDQAYVTRGKPLDVFERYMKQASNNKSVATFPAVGVSSGMGS